MRSAGRETRHRVDRSGHLLQRRTRWHLLRERVHNTRRLRRLQLRLRLSGDEVLRLHCWLWRLLLLRLLLRQRLLL